MKRSKILPWMIILAFILCGYGPAFAQQSGTDSKNPTVRMNSTPAYTAQSVDFSKLDQDVQAQILQFQQKKTELEMSFQSCLNQMKESLQSGKEPGLALQRQCEQIRDQINELDLEVRKIKLESDKTDDN